MLVEAFRITCNCVPRWVLVPMPPDPIIMPALGPDAQHKPHMSTSKVDGLVASMTLAVENWLPQMGAANVVRHGKTVSPENEDLLICSKSLGAKEQP
jgi:hypothetical protein